MAYIYNLADTWADAGVTFTAIKMNVLDTASNAASLLMDLQVGGTSFFRVQKNGLVEAGRFGVTGQNGMQFNPATGQLSLSRSADGGTVIALNAPSNNISAGSFILGSDTILVRDGAANTLALRNGTNAQTFRAYNTFTDASNYERGKMEWASNVLRIGTEKLGTGLARALELQTDGVTRLTIATGGAVSTSSQLDVFGVITLRGSTEGTRRFNVNGFASIRFPSDGVYTFFNDAGSDFNRLQFGGTTSSFPALKRNATALETKLADDSAFAPHAMQYLDVTDGVTAPGAAAGRARIYVDTADGDLKVVFADGTVKTIVTDT